MAKSKIIKNEKLNEIISEDSEPTNLNLKQTTPNTKIDDGVLIKVKSNVFGRLIYKNSKTEEETLWNKCGEVQVLTMGDLRAMKANQSKFFTNQWVIILGLDESSECKANTADIYKALGITKYYENLVEPSDFETVCNWSEKEIMEKVSFMNDNAKANLVIALNEYIDKGVLDSRKTIGAFERALGVDLTESD